MAISITVTVTCDSRRVSGCHRSVDLWADPAPAAVAAGWRQADELGWTILRDDVAELHLCPVCNGVRLVGADVLPPPAEPAALPRTIGEAAARDRQRMHQDGG